LFIIPASGGPSPGMPSRNSGGTNSSMIHYAAAGGAAALRPLRGCPGQWWPRRAAGPSQCRAVARLTRTRNPAHSQARRDTRDSDSARRASPCGATDRDSPSLSFPARAAVMPRDDTGRLSHGVTGPGPAAAAPPRRGGDRGSESP
jgi:hypothetical protein